MGFDLATFTLVHVALSLLGIVAGLVVAGGLISGRRLDGWTGAFLLTTALTNLSGFGFPFVRFLPAHGVGIVSLLLLPLVLYALYGRKLAGTWRTMYVVAAVTLLYLNVFVLVAQLFLRTPALIVAAPTQTEPPFLITQLGVLALFVWLGKAAVRGFAADARADGLMPVSPARTPARL
ncbi:MAG TPA: hypothetical protein VH764_08055 [Gemmatimonadales bacterium]|jgi:hypothetical protein